jgi:hypothetical protein
MCIFPAVAAPVARSVLELDGLRTCAPVRSLIGKVAVSLASELLEEPNPFKLLLQRSLLPPPLA